LAELTRSRSHEPHVSYKELKHTVSKLSSLIGATGGGGCTSDNEDGASSLDEANALPSASVSVSGGSTGDRSGRQQFTGNPAFVDTHQHEFFNRLHGDIAQARAYVQSSVTALEAQIGDWQSSAILAGVLFTPVQLDEISASLPFQMQDRQLLVEWLFGLCPAEKRRASGQRLLDKYCAFARNLNGLLQYIEMNLTAIRKIFKKFEKKVPVDFHIQNIREYKAHHDLCMPAMQDVLVASVRIHKFVLNVLAEDLGTFGEDPAQIVPACEIGPESLVMLSRLRGSTLDDILAASPMKTQIDVYAKPTVVDSGGPNGARRSTADSQAVAGTSSSSAAPAELPGRHQQRPSHSKSMIGLDVFRGPPQAPQHHQASSGSASTSTSKLKISFMGMPAPSSGKGGNRIAGQEPNGATFGCGHCGGRGGGQKGRGGRRNTQPGQGAGNKTRPQAAPEHAPAAAAATQAGQAMPSYGLGSSSSGMMPPTAVGFPMPQPYVVAGFPVFAGKKGGYKGAQRAAACHSGWGGHSGKGNSGNAAAGAAGMDPQWLAAMMPMFWSQGMMPPPGMAPQGPD